VAAALCSGESPSAVGERLGLSRQTVGTIAWRVARRALAVTAGRPLGPGATVPSGTVSGGYRWLWWEHRRKAGALLRELRKKVRLSRWKMWHMAGTPPDWLQRLEEGHMSINVERLRRLLEIYGMAWDEFLAAVLKEE